MTNTVSIPLREHHSVVLREGMSINDLFCLLEQETFNFKTDDEVILLINKLINLLYKIDINDSKLRSEYCDKLSDTMVLIIKKIINDHTINGDDIDFQFKIDQLYDNMSSYSDTMYQEYHTNKYKLITDMILEIKEHVNDYLIMSEDDDKLINHELQKRLNTLLPIYLPRGFEADL